MLLQGTMPLHVLGVEGAHSDAVTKNLQWSVNPLSGGSNVDKECTAVPAAQHE